MVINGDKINLKEKGRPPVPGNIKNAIATYHRKHPTWSAAKIRERIRRIWFDGLKHEHPDWTNEKIKSYIKLPVPNTISKCIRENKPDENGCLSKLWQLSLLDKFKKEISPDALFEISQIQRFCEIVNLDEFPPITISQALWIAKLLPFTSYFQYQWEKNKEIRKKNEAYNWRLMSLYRWSKAYAEYQAMCKLAGTDFDTTELDKGLRSGAIPLTSPDIQVQGTTISKTGAVVLFRPDSNEVNMVTLASDVYGKSAVQTIDEKGRSVIKTYVTKDGEK